MAGELSARKAAARQARGILRRQLRKALKKLDGSHDADDEDIHEARKRIKQARATLRLMRETLPRAHYRREDRTLQASAHPLSLARDAKVLVEAFDRLLAHHREARQAGGTRALRRALVRQRTAARASVRGENVRRARRGLRRARACARGWSLGKKGWRRLARGATRQYAQGRECLEAVRREATVETLHRWRKQAKYLYLQLELLTPVCVAEVRRLACGLRRLSDELGDDHDLAMLRETIASRTDPIADAASATALATVIERSRTNLQRRALLRGARLYRLAPERFTALLEQQPRAARSAR